MNKITLDFKGAAERISVVTKNTPLQLNAKLSEIYKANIFLKREDLQTVRSYKIRGAFNKISSLSAEQRMLGVVCASAGNHAQGVAHSCSTLGIKCTIFMPVITPRQKVTQTQHFGRENVEIVLTGDNFDECMARAVEYADDMGAVFIPPFDDEKVIEGQGTIMAEVYDVLPEVDYVIAPIGGGGLAAGLLSYINAAAKGTKVIAAEPVGAASMTAALAAGEPVMLEEIDRFVDGAAVKRIGAINYAILKNGLDRVLAIPEGKVCTTILRLYNNDAIVVEPAGALAIAALDLISEEIAGKTVVCIVSGSNNDIERMQEIKERSLLYEGLKHYFIVEFPQRPGALKQFVTDALGPDDDITRFEFIKKTNKDQGPALVGIELTHKDNYAALVENIKRLKFNVRELKQDELLYSFLV